MTIFEKILLTTNLFFALGWIMSARKIKKTIETERKLANAMERTKTTETY